MHSGYPAPGQGAPKPDDSLPGPDGGTLLPAHRSGFLFADGSGSARVVLPDRDHRYDRPRHRPVPAVRRGEPTVLVALLPLLRDVATAVHSDAQRAEVLRQVDLVVGELRSDIAEVDAASVHDLARRVRQVVAGDVDAAFADRSGETRSY